jgi:hypothetical protein
MFKGWAPIVIASSLMLRHNKLEYLFMETFLG